MKYVQLIFIYLLTINTFSYSKETILNGESKYLSFSSDEIPYVISDTIWDVESRGNHRALVEVDKQKYEAVIVSLPWRRADLRPETKKIIVTDANSGNEISDVYVIDLTSEKGTIAFKPNTGVSKYYIYYLPYNFRYEPGNGRFDKPWNDYIKPVYDADEKWRKSIIKNQTKIPYASVKQFESRTQFDYFTSMGIIATEKEKAQMIRNNKSDFLTFPEDRAFPIKLTTIPYRWVANGPSLFYNGNAHRNEYYTWQVGLWAMEKDLKDVKVSMKDLVHESNSFIIPKSEITCFNMEGINWDGTPLNFTLDVPANKVQALWFGVQIPENAKSGKYKGQLSVSSLGTDEKFIDIEIDVDNELLSDKGDGDLWRHSRLRWLNSTIGIDSLPVEPFENMQLKDRKIVATDKEVVIAKNGAIESIKINNQIVNTQPFEFILETKNGKFKLSNDNMVIQKDDEGIVSWKSSSNFDNGISLTVTASMEYDGYINYNVQLKSDGEVQLNNVSLVNFYSPESSEYFIGAGLNGGFRPKNYTWDWTGPYDSFWLGGPKSGLHLELRGGEYHGPLIYDYSPDPPQSWYNEGKGKVKLFENGVKGTVVEVSTGEMKVNQSIDFEFAYIITPTKPIDLKSQFSQRYYHSETAGFNHAASEGANIANIHHSRVLNPVINYPFIVRDSLIQFIKEQHKEDRKVKLYYTIRELTNYTEEIFALKSLNHEIFPSGVGHGAPWQTEHLIDDYRLAWYTALPNQMSDASLVLNGFSRWINYYLEGLRWMLENYEIDGLYLDDVSFDRRVMKRMRKIMNETRPGSLIDLHSCENYSFGPANQYADFFPYLDRLWFGENFKYNEMRPDEWFVMFSGIPFGVMSETLQDGGNTYLSMVYGAAGRHSTSNISPAAIWKLWSDFKIDESEMIGYWDDKCPVKTNHEDVKATLFVKPDEILISIGNFYEDEKEVELIFDWEELNIDPNKAILEIPTIIGYQMQESRSINEKFAIKGKRGLILILKEKD